MEVLCIFVVHDFVEAKKPVNLCTSSAHAPQMVAAPVASMTSSKVVAPLSTASFIIPFVMLIQLHTILSKSMFTTSLSDFFEIILEVVYVR